MVAYFSFGIVLLVILYIAYLLEEVVQNLKNLYKLFYNMSEIDINRAGFDHRRMVVYDNEKEYR